MDIKPIRTHKDHKAALMEIERILDAGPDSAERDKLDVLATLVEKYEDEHWPIDPPDPIEAIKFRMEQSGYSQKDLADVLGSAPRASEILNRRRHLTVDMIRQISDQWRIPAESLIRPYELDR